VNHVLRLVVLAGLFMTAGCLSWPVGFSEASSPLSHGQYTVLAKEVTGTDTQVKWLWFAFGKGGSCQRHALDSALGQVPGATALTAMSVEVEEFIVIPFLLPTITTTRVTGTPVRALDNDGQ